jgi:hypothetical protein
VVGQLILVEPVVDSTLVAVHQTDFGLAPEDVEFLPLLRLKHIVDPSLETRVRPH